MASQPSNNKSDNWYRWERPHPRTPACLARSARIIAFIISHRAKTNPIPLMTTKHYHMYNHKNTIIYHQGFDTRYNFPYGLVKTKMT